MKPLKPLPKIGLRTIKTTIAVFISLLLFSSEAFFACTTAIVCLQNTVPDSIKTGKDRVFGVIIGGTLGGLFLIGIHKIPRLISYKWSHVLVYALISIGVLATIYICILVGANEIVPLATIVFISITTTYAADIPMLYAINRIIETVCGMVIAVLVNKFCNFGRRDKNWGKGV